MNKMLIAAGIISILAATPATAQLPLPLPLPDSLINVSLKDIRAEIARNAKIDLSKVPITINLPITVAANVCGSSVNVLSAQVQAGNNTCTATNVSAASQAVTNTVQ
jgi:hypothetical protein